MVAVACIDEVSHRQLVPPLDKEEILLVLVLILVGLCSGSVVVIYAAVFRDVAGGVDRSP